MKNTSFFKAVAAGLALAFSPGCYYAGLAKGQWDVMNGTVPVNQVVMRDNPDVNLSCVISDIKRFAVDVVGLESNDSYSEFYPVDREGMTFVVTACEKFSFNQYLWCYPVLGCSPFRGFFEKSEAIDLEAKLRSEGFDTFMFTSVAYSTLGLLDDPVTPFMLDRGLYGLTETIIHEMTHQKVFVGSHVDFSEELASFVGSKAARQFLLSKGVNHGGMVAGLELRREKGKLFSSAVMSAISELEAVYGSGESEGYMLTAREMVFDDLRSRILEIYPGYAFERLEFNNARLLSEAVYVPDSSRIKKLWDEGGGSWKKFWGLVDEYIDENF